MSPTIPSRRLGRASRQLLYGFLSFSLLLRLFDCDVARVVLTLAASETTAKFLCQWLCRERLNTWN